MQNLNFSLSAETFDFVWADHHIRLNHGLDFIQQYSMPQGVWSELAIEKMIYVIEELLESDAALRQLPSMAVTSDAMMSQLNQLFFKTTAAIDRIQLENGFNDFVDHITHYVHQIGEAQQQALIYFVVLREMMHHLKIEKILFNPSE